MQSDLLLRRTPAVLFVLWAMAAVIVTMLRPGQLLEIATIGVVGTVAWRALLRTRTGGGLVLGALCLLLPMTNTWPARIYQSFVDFSPVPLPAFLSLVSVGAMAGLVVQPTARLRAPRLLMAAWALLVLGAVVAALGSERVLPSLGYTWVSFVAPAAFAATVTSRMHREEGWQVLNLILLGALVPLTMGIAAYVLSFGIPVSGDDLLAGRILLFRPHLLQEVTFGNVGHLVDFVLLLLPAAVIAGTRRVCSTTLRVTALLTALASVVVLTLILSRSAIAVAELALLAVFAILVARRELRAAIIPLIGITLLTAVVLSPSVRTTYASLVPSISVVSASPAPSLPSQVTAAASDASPFPAVSPAASASPSPGASAPPVGGTDLPTVVVGPIQVVASDPSQRERIDAIRQGAAVFAEHMPWGVGSGQYNLYDPAHTASHSLLIQTLVEIGVLGAVGLVLLYVFVVREAARSWLYHRVSSENTNDLRWACLLGAGSFLVQGLIAGAPLSLGALSVWASLLWLLLFIAGAPQSDVGEA